MRRIINQIAACALLGIGSIAVAGGRDGGGGHNNCLEYINWGLKVEKELQLIGQDTIRTVLPLAELSRYVQRIEALRCLPADKSRKKKMAGRAAFTLPNEQLTFLDVDKWKRLSRVEKVNLTIHEINVLTEYEQDGQYIFTDRMQELFRAHSSVGFRLDLNTKLTSWTQTPEGYYTIVRPMFWYSDQHGRGWWVAESNNQLYHWIHFHFGDAATLVGICRYFGFARFRAFTPAIYDLPQTSNSPISTVLLDENGKLTNIIEERRPYVGEITCSGPLPTMPSL